MKKQESVSSIAKLYKAPLPSTRSGPIYNAFPYPTKISPEAIAVYIATHTDPGVIRATRLTLLARHLGWL